MGLNKERFIADFERIMEDHKLRRTTFSDEYETSLFIGKIGGIHDV
jgi:hypothetical protein